MERATAPHPQQLAAAACRPLPLSPKPLLPLLSSRLGVSRIFRHSSSKAWGGARRRPRLFD